MNDKIPHYIITWAKVFDVIYLRGKHNDTKNTN